MNRFRRRHHVHPAIEEPLVPKKRDLYKSGVKCNSCGKGYLAKSRKTTQREPKDF